MKTGPGRTGWALLAILLPALAFALGSRGDERLPQAAEKVTFSKEIVRILQGHCQRCHHPGGVGPFGLVTYRDAYRHRKAMVKETAARDMPPWSVAADCAKYQDDPSLSQKEIDTIAQWVQSGAPEGNPRDLPPRRVFRKWELGEPDLQFTFQKPFTPQFSKGGDEYRCFVFPTQTPEDRWVGAVAVLPGNPKMVHHALVWVEKGSSSEKLVGNDPSGSYSCFGSSVVPTDSIGEWVPGTRPHLFPSGTGRFFPKNARVILQIHYSAHYAMKARAMGPDRTSVGIYFAKQPVQKPVVATWVYGPDTFVIPAGDAHHTLKGSLTLSSPARVLAVWPHMHLLGRTMKITATLPGGKQQCLVNVTDWDFHWQRTYWLETPPLLPARTRVDLVATYDNSAGNPNNPSSPPRDVTLGMDTTNEMSQAALYYTVETEDAGKGKPSPRR
jgi:mono/diheme cytochrome c family protein